MANILGRKGNFCLLNGVQGVVETILSDNTSGSSVVFAADNPKNNTLYIFKEYSGGIFGTVPETPSADYNFKVTIKDSSGFSGTLANVVKLYSTPTTATSSIQITVKYDNPDFDITDNYTVLHLHFWYDGLNYCCKVDGYV